MGAGPGNARERFGVGCGPSVSDDALLDPEGMIEGPVQCESKIWTGGGGIKEVSSLPGAVAGMSVRSATLGCGTLANASFKELSGGGHGGGGGCPTGMPNEVKGPT